MIEYRTFLNSDTPALAYLWNLQAPHPLRLRHSTIKLWDELPLGKLAFDPCGLWLAHIDDIVLGFAHASLVPTTSCGVIHQLVIAPATAPLWHVDSHLNDDLITLRATVADQLLDCCRDYLTERGATRLLAGGWPPLDPFYLGFAGGSQSYGLLAEDHEVRACFERGGFTEGGSRVVWQRSLAGFRPPVDRLQLQWKRTATLHSDWQAAPLASVSAAHQVATFASRERCQFELALKTQPSRAARIVAWDMQPLANEWGVRAMGLIDFQCDDEAWTDGLALYTLAEALRQFQQRGIDLVEIQTSKDDNRGTSLVRSLGFTEVATTSLLERPAA
ncbi:MAG: hypothetical protein ACKOU6_12025 [Planctomycetota bacterium]